MPESESLRSQGFSILEDDLHFLMQAFSQALTNLGDASLARRLPWLENKGEIDTGEVSTDRKLGQAYSIAFQLLNIVEERTASRVRRMRETSHGPAAERGLWADQMQRMRKAGLSSDQILQTLRSVLVEPVLTAHPTEAKRETARERHREIYDLMNRHENTNYTPREQQRLQRMLQVQLEGLWRTGEIHVTRPTIDAELQNALYYLRDVFPEALTRAHVHLSEAWQAAGFEADALDDLPPLIKFGNWIGGDRDGHPFVTAEVTARTLQALRQNALRVQRRALESLAHQLPLSSLFAPVPEELSQLIAKLTDLLRNQPGVDVDYIMERNHEEPWREAAYLMRARVMLALDHPEATGAYQQPGELAADLTVLADALDRSGAALLRRELIVPFQRKIAAFGFHSAALDVRQNSAFHDMAMSQLLAAAGVEDGANYAEWSPGRKRTFLERELASPRPFLAPGITGGKEAETVLSSYRVLAAHRSRHGDAGLGALIVSMTRRVEDLFAVYILAREAGLTEWTMEGLLCPLQVTPLFETMADLEAGPGIVGEFLAHPVTRRSLLGRERPTMQIMVGYSDSNKDCGIFASQWALHRAQAALARTVISHGLQPVFFHGRGGTVGRGAGPTHFFMEALPAGSLHGNLRMTEQGETIGQKYAHFGSAVFNLELLMASASTATALHRGANPPPDSLHEILDRMANWSRDAYRALLTTPDFMAFYRSATPIDALEHARIGSRPSRRTGQATLEDLRAIPWVFSWTQARFYLPGWFGAGTALEKLKHESPEGWNALKSQASNHPFLRYVLANIESSLVSAREDWMRRYAALVEDQAIRERFLGIILAEYRRTSDLLDDLFAARFETRRPRMAYTLAIREQPLSVLHEQQLHLLKTWRSAATPEVAEAMMPDLLVSINAVASGLRTTG